MATKEKIVRVLQLLASSGKVAKPDRQMYEAWKIALTRYQDDLCEKALMLILDEGIGHNYHCKTEDFTKVCRSITRSQTIGARKENESNQYDVLSAKEAANLQNEIFKVPVKKSPHKRYYDVVEYCSPDGKTAYFMCHNHVDVQKFIESCKYEFHCGFLNVKHVFYTDKKEPIKDDHGQTIRLKNIFSKSGSSGYPVTVGYP